MSVAFILTRQSTRLLVYTRKEWNNCARAVFFSSSSFDFFFSYQMQIFTEIMSPLPKLHIFTRFNCIYLKTWIKFILPTLFRFISFTDGWKKVKRKTMQTVEKKQEIQTEEKVLKRNTWEKWFYVGGWKQFTKYTRWALSNGTALSSCLINHVVFAVVHIYCVCVWP